jgi:HPt (histidine-containing phosphotransfer) domain-containing protein
LPETGKPAGLPVFDESALLGRLMGDRKLERRILGGFLDDIPKQLAALASNLNACDASAAGRTAHSIEGAAASVSAAALRDVAYEMEWRPLMLLAR